MKKLVTVVGVLLLISWLSLTPALAQGPRGSHMMAPRVPADKIDEARALTSPLPYSAEIVEKGKAIYEGKGTCINCHGARGRGDGPGAVNLNPPPRVFRSHGFWMHRSEGEIFWVIKHGSPGTAMIPFGGMLTDEEIWTVMQYERSFAGGPRGRGGPRHGRGGRHRGGGMMRHHLQGDPQGGSGARAAVAVPNSSMEEVKEKIQRAKSASISMDRAIQLAVKEVSGTVLEVEFEVEVEEGQAFWEVEVGTDEGQIIEVKIDSQNGAVLSTDEKRGVDQAQAMQKGSCSAADQSSMAMHSHEGCRKKH